MSFVKKIQFPFLSSSNPIIAALEQGINPFQSLYNHEPEHILDLSKEKEKQVTEVNANVNGSSKPELVQDNGRTVDSVSGPVTPVKMAVTPTKSDSSDKPPTGSPVKSPYKSWTDAIWGPKDLSPTKPSPSSTEMPSEASKGLEEGGFKSSSDSTVNPDQAAFATDHIGHEHSSRGVFR